MLNIGLSAWIIQDGNYGDFEAGRAYRFALEFYPQEVHSTLESSREATLSPIGSALHDAVGKIIFRSDGVWVVDFGVPAFYQSHPPEWATIGSLVEGRVYIGVDPFLYFESLIHSEGMPDLFRHWLVRRISLETTPWIEATDSQGRKILTRDTSRESFRDVPATDAWNHDKGHGHYVLECELVSGQAV